MEEKNLTFQAIQEEYGLPASVDFKGPKKVKILQVIIGLGPAGIENWLMEVLRRLDRQRFKMDFLVHESPHLLEDEAKALSSKIILCPYNHRPWTYAANFRYLLRKHGPYQVIHTHFPRGGYMHLLARYSGIPVRIHQYHNDEIIRRTQINWRRRFSLGLSDLLIRQFATHGLAVSRVAALGAFGPDWKSDRRWRIFPAVNDFSAFTTSVNRQEVRRALGLPESAFVLGHVGRFDAQKNHGFLIDIAAEVCRLLPEAHLLLVGDGQLRSGIEEKVSQLGLRQRVIFTGIRTDVPLLMQGAMDAFLFPSIYEGLGVAVLEAQAAGLPCVITDTIPEEVTIIPELIRRVSLKAGARSWAEAVMDLRNHRATLGAQEVAERIRGTLFDIETNVRHLEALYAHAAKAHPQFSEY